MSMAEAPIAIPPDVDAELAGSEAGLGPRTWLDRIASVAIGIAGVALVGMVAVQALQVFARYVLNDSPGWTEPVALLLLNTAMSFGAAAGVHRGSHFGFFILVHSAPPALRKVLLSATNLVIAGIGFVLAMWGGELLLDGIDIPMAGAPLPQSAVFAPMSVAGALMVPFALQRLVAVITAPVASARSE
ncbi:TRAP transporter small permease [Lysobacter sp. S4-A87]|uniref:TRAP transporter small permease n=1 Tax=Lysobacter sp. S4-A87 TaxID=2925843 RepID=UPI001F52FFED|nr:TRAP transporter small permease [Lysobacter sp. S4-A87]UNK51177.1 TRAP transporter small permease [Lysobacter sp. S4-A87]